MTRSTKVDEPSLGVSKKWMARSETGKGGIPMSGWASKNGGGELTSEEVGKKRNWCFRSKVKNQIREKHRSKQPLAGTTRERSKGGNSQSGGRRSREGGARKKSNGACVTCCEGK